MICMSLTLFQKAICYTAATVSGGAVATEECLLTYYSLLHQYQ